MDQTASIPRIVLPALVLAMIGAALAPALAEEGSEPSYVTGKVSDKKILKIGPEWQAAYDAYKPDEGALARIRSASQRGKAEIAVEVVFGSWCGDSRDGVPQYIKMQDLLGRDRLKTTYIGVDRSKKDPKGKVEGKDIQRVPTYIVTWKGIEMGRIIEIPKVTIEDDLAAILESPGRP